MLGYAVTVDVLNAKAAQAVLAVREAFEKTESIAKWLAAHPNSGPDPLTQAPFNYSADEAYAMRVYFETLETTRVGLASTFDTGRKLTGLE